MEKTPIVILPGWMLEADKYQKIAQIFKINGYQTNIVDFPGFDHQDLKKVLNLTDYVKFLHQYLKSHQIREAIFIAHSFGGRVALKYLSQEPKKAKALIISGTPGFLPVSKIKLTLFLILAKIGGFIFSIPVINKLKNFIRRVYYKLIGAKDFYHVKGLMRETFKNIIKEPLKEYMQKIQFPTLLLWGENDKVVSVTIAKQMQKTIRKSTLVMIPNQGHMFITHDSQQFTSEVMKFLNSL